jgi:hypothetical protein
MLCADNGRLAKQISASLHHKNPSPPNRRGGRITFAGDVAASGGLFA